MSNSLVDSDHHSWRWVIGLVLPAEQSPEGLSVSGAHGVVDQDVEGGVDVCQHIYHPDAGHDKVVVVSTRVHLGHETPAEPAAGKEQTAHQHESGHTTEESGEQFNKPHGNTVRE